MENQVPSLYLQKAALVTTCPSSFRCEPSFNILPSCKKQVPSIHNLPGPSHFGLWDDVSGRWLHDSALKIVAGETLKFFVRPLPQIAQLFSQKLLAATQFGGRIFNSQFIYGLNVSRSYDEGRGFLVSCKIIDSGTFSILITLEALRADSEVGDSDMPISVSSHRRENFVPSDEKLSSLILLPTVIVASQGAEQPRKTSSQTHRLFELTT